jgi:hypothetical protein
MSERLKRAIIAAIVVEAVPTVEFGGAKEPAESEALVGFVSIRGEHIFADPAPSWGARVSVARSGPTGQVGRILPGLPVGELASVRRKQICFSFCHMTALRSRCSDAPLQVLLAVVAQRRPAEEYGRNPPFSSISIEGPSTRATEGGSPVPEVG